MSKWFKLIQNIKKILVDFPFIIAQFPSLVIIMWMKYRVWLENAITCTVSSYKKQGKKNAPGYREGWLIVYIPGMM